MHHFFFFLTISRCCAQVHHYFFWCILISCILFSGFTQAELCVRFNGGANAGHTLVVGGEKYAFHLLPCGFINRVHTHMIKSLGILKQINNFNFSPFCGVIEYVLPRGQEFSTQVQCRIFPCPACVHSSSFSFS